MRPFLTFFLILIFQISLIAKIEYPYLSKYEDTDLSNYERYMASMKIVERILLSNIKSSALEELTIKKSVPLTFVLGKDGKIKKFQVKEGNYPDLSKQLALLADHLPNNWKPMIKDEIAVDYDLGAFLALKEIESNIQLKLYYIPPPPPPPMLCGYYRFYKTNARFPAANFKARTKAEQKKASQEAMIKFIYENLKYPSEVSKEIEGTVVITVTVEKDGQLTNHKIARDIGGGLGEEALRVIKMMPRWIPAINRNGMPVKQTYHIPVKFRLK